MSHGAGVLCWRGGGRRAAWGADQAGDGLLDAIAHLVGALARDAESRRNLCAGGMGQVEVFEERQRREEKAGRQGGGDGEPLGR
ncbi:MAG: hypothetical protein JRI25_16920 [Deltaproteobacteria bacterium]|nr:hypothetical protein [Deltaproteobacteria bacterium]MBW2256260.1 hypothetical protein [Deltaproteobacteria bacterium]